MGLLVVLGCVLLAPAALAAPAGTTHLPDIQTVIPTDPPNSFSIVQGADGREFRYTHLVYNNGPGPLEIQPEYNQASGTYQGQQLLFTHNAAGAWSQVRQVKVPDAFVFHAAHGHFHFPLAAFGLYKVAADGGLGDAVALSPKNGFCIADSYISNTTVEHSGAFVGSQGSCADPTTLRGMSVGGADEYDYRDPGQAVPIPNLPDGTYWFHAISDPNNDFVEADESNNETNVKVTIANNRVTAGETTHPDTSPPPITMTAPAGGAQLAGTVPLSATTNATGGVEFLLDGVVIGTSTSSASPYTFSWDSRTAVDGSHWLAARTRDGLGRINTSAVVPVTVSNLAPPPPPSGGAFTTDGSVSQDGRGAQTSPGLTTTQGGDLLLAFVAADGPSTGSQTTTVSGGGLTWSLVRRANTRHGTSEIWKAVAAAKLSGATFTSTLASSGFDQSFTVTAISGAAGVGVSAGAGAATGAPRVSLTTSAQGSWVFGVGNDWDGALPRTPASGQRLDHQWVDSAPGDTFWAQSMAAKTAASGALVTLEDTAPTNHQWNFASVEVLAGALAPPPPPPPADTTPPTVRIDDPVDHATVTGVCRLGATASDNVGVTKVRFKVDGQALGVDDTAPPFSTEWDTRTAPQGQHTITAEATDAAGNVGASAGVAVTVDNSAPPPAALSIDKQVTARARSTLTATGMTTAAAGEQLVAFVAMDGPSGAAGQRATVAGAGLTWTLVKRSDSQSGVSEIWTARATGTLTNASITATPLRSGSDGLLDVIAFTNAAGVGVAGASGAPSGAPDIYLPGVATGSWVFAVGNDWDHAVARTPTAGQVLQQQWIDTPVGDTFWVQSTTAPNAGAPGLVTIHDTAPANDRWNYAAVEVTAKPAGS